MLSGHLRGTLMEAVRYRRQTFPPYLACASAVLTLGGLPLVWPACRRATRLPFIGAGFILAAAGCQVFGWQIMQDNALIGLTLMQAEEHVQHVRASHEQAVHILSRREREPFVLLLRSFDEVVERRKGSEAIRPGSPGATQTLRLFGRDARAEEKLAEPLRRWFPVAAVHNASDDFTGARADNARFFVPEEDWRTVVCQLIKLARYICVHVTQLTPGVAFELEAILEAGREDSAVVILCDLPDDDADVRNVVYTFFRGVGYDAPDPVLARRTDAPLNRFHEVLRQKEIDFAALDRCPPFAGWIAARDRGAGSA